MTNKKIETFEMTKQFYQEFLDVLIEDFKKHAKEWEECRNEPIKNKEYDEGFHKGYCEALGYTLIKLSFTKKAIKDCEES